MPCNRGFARWSIRSVESVPFSRGSLETWRLRALFSGRDRASEQETRGGERPCDRMTGVSRDLLSDEYKCSYPRCETVGWI